MNDWIVVTNKVMDLYSDTYYSAVNSVLWGQERLLSLSKALVSQLETTQSDGKKLIDDLTERSRQSQNLFQEIWQEGVKATTSNLNAFKVASDAAIVELDRTIDSINGKIAAAPVRKG